MYFNLERSSTILGNTPNILRQMLANLPESLIHQNEGGNSWSPFDIVGHFIHGEKTDWIPRAQIILSDKAYKNFEPFNRFAQFDISKGKSIAELLDEFEELRRENIRILNELDLSPENLQKTGIHPEFGEVTLDQLLCTWEIHDMNHISQLARVLGNSYKDGAGPWLKYITLFRRRINS